MYFYTLIQRVGVHAVLAFIPAHKHPHSRHYAHALKRKHEHKHMHEHAHALGPIHMQYTLHLKFLSNVL